MIADSKAKEQEGFLPVKKCIFKPPYQLFIPFFHHFCMIPCIFDDFHAFWTLFPLFFGRKPEEFLPIPGRNRCKFFSRSAMRKNFFRFQAEIATVFLLRNAIQKGFFRFLEQISANSPPRAQSEGVLPISGSVFMVSLPRTQSEEFLPITRFRASSSWLNDPSQKQKKPITCVHTDDRQRLLVYSIIPRFYCPSIFNTLIILSFPSFPSPPSILTVLRILDTPSTLFSDLQSLQLPGSQKLIGLINALAPQHLEDILQGQVPAISLAEMDIGSVQQKCADPIRQTPEQR